ncbi:MAG: hypothetical protein CVT88_02195 [Candidatus Altiarchaeales archaeon HGW-Altiarchaeales-1]|nr:MAG: hypothetical protein CVT88_02195 [Candidatus Altiarchaeales archaeon HGW-Altiarchaeales-1]
MHGTRKFKKEHTKINIKLAQKKIYLVKNLIIFQRQVLYLINAGKFSADKVYKNNDIIQYVPIYIILNLKLFHIF